MKSQFHQFFSFMTETVNAVYAESGLKVMQKPKNFCKKGSDFMQEVVKSIEYCAMRYNGETYLEEVIRNAL